MNTIGNSGMNITNAHSINTDKKSSATVKNNSSEIATTDKFQPSEKGVKSDYDGIGKAFKVLVGGGVAAGVGLGIGAACLLGGGVAAGVAAGVVGGVAGLALLGHAFKNMFNF